VADLVAGVMYLPSRDRVVAVDGDTGMGNLGYALAFRRGTRERRARPPGPGGGGPQVSTAGVSYWPGDGTLLRAILFMSRANLVRSTPRPANSLRASARTAWSTSGIP